MSSIQKLKETPHEENDQGNGWSEAEKIVSDLESVTVTALWWIWDWEGRPLTWSCTKVKIARKGSKDNPFELLIDLGAYQWWDEDTVIRLNRELPFNPSNIDAVVLTHAHIDHNWRLPMLVNTEWKKFDWPVYASKVTAMLSLISLEDSANIMQDNLESTQNRASRLRSFLSSQLAELRKLEESLNPPSKKDKKQKKWGKWKRNSNWNQSRYEQIQEIRSTHTKQEIEEKIRQIKSLLEDYQVEDNSDIARVFAWRLQRAKDKVLFSHDDVYEIYSRMVQTSMYNRVEISPWVHLRFFKAAHILGSTQAVLEIDKWDGTTLNLWFSWDVGRFFDPLYLGTPDIPEVPFDYYQIESTYGDREHNSREKEHKEISEKVNQVYKRWWKIVIPSFMTQRIQDVAVYLLKMMENGEIPKMPIYYDWWYVDKINNIYRFSEIEDYKKLWSNQLKPVQKDEASPNRFLKHNWPCILLSPSGMMHWWSIQKYIKNVLSDSKNALFFVGFQAKGTPWRDILNWQKRIEVPWIWYVDIEAQIEAFGGFSWHWDQLDLGFLASEIWTRSNHKIWVNHWDSWSSQDELVRVLQDNGLNAEPMEVGKTQKIY